jgi:hypothetical protein
MELCRFDPFGIHGYIDPKTMEEGPSLLDQYKHRGIHWQFPHGTYNTLMEGGCTELDEYLSTGTMTGLHKQTELFNELK